MWSVEDSAKLLARVLGPSWWPDITWPRNFASGKGWEMEALWEQRLQKKIRMWSLFAGMSKLNVGGPFFAKQVLAFLQQNACLRKQIARDQNDHLVMQSKDSAERAFHSQVCPAAVTQVTAKAVPVQMCYLSVSLLTLWLNRSSCGRRAISALYHTVWHFVESFRVFSWKNFLPWLEVLKKFTFFYDTQKCPKKQLYFPEEIESWQHVSLPHIVSLRVPKSYHCVLVRKAICMFLEDISLKT